MIIITSKVDGYRRCGVEHPKAPTHYPDKRFSEDELKVLQQTPVLDVQIVQNNKDPEPPNTGSENSDQKEPRYLKAEELETMTVEELKARANILKVELTSRMLKKDIIDLLIQVPLPDSYPD